MNLLKSLFGRHAPAARAPATSCQWPGQSGKQYTFAIYPLNATLQPRPGIYIYAKQLGHGEWSPIYLSQTRDLHQRLEGHVNLPDAIAHGATHLHAHYCDAGPSARFTEEHDLVQRWQPECNDVVPS